MLTRSDQTAGANIYICGSSSDWNAISSGGGGGSVSWGGIMGLITNQTDLNTALLARELAANKGATNGYAPLVSSLVPVANLGTGTPDVTKVLFGDGTWKLAPTGSGGGARTVEHLAAINAAGAAASGWSLPAVNYPTATAIAGTQTPARVYGVLRFADTVSQSAQNVLSATACAAITAEIRWNTTDVTAGNTVVWGLRTMFLAAGSVGSTQAWNTQQFVTANPIVTASGVILSTITLNAGSLTGCVAGTRMSYELSRDITDTSTAAADLTAVIWTL